MMGEEAILPELHEQLSQIHVEPESIPSDSIKTLHVDLEEFSRVWQYESSSSLNLIQKGFWA